MRSFLTFHFLLFSGSFVSQICQDQQTSSKERWCGDEGFCWFSIGWASIWFKANFLYFCCIPTNKIYIFLCVFFFYLIILEDIKKNRYAHTYTDENQYLVRIKLILIENKEYLINRSLYVWVILLLEKNVFNLNY